MMSNFNVGDELNEIRQELVALKSIVSSNFNQLHDVEIILINERLLQISKRIEILELIRKYF